MIKKGFYFFICLSGLLVNLAFGQDTTAVWLKAPYDGVIIYLDSVRQTKQTSVFISTPGIHRIQVWAPTRNLLDSLVELKKGANFIKVKLGHSKEFLLWQDKEYYPYKNLRDKRVKLSPVFITASLSGGILLSLLAEKYYEDALKNKKEYFHARYNNNAQSFKKEFQSNKSKFYQTRAYSYVLYSISGGISLNYLRLLKKNKSLVEPKFIETPFLSNFDGSLYFDGNTTQFILKYKL